MKSLLVGLGFRLRSPGLTPNRRFYCPLCTPASLRSLLRALLVNGQKQRGAGFGVSKKSQNQASHQAHGIWFLWGEICHALTMSRHV